MSLATVLNQAIPDTAVLEQLNERIDIIRHKLKFLESKPVVACIISLDPLRIADSWITEMVEIAGGIPVIANGDHLTEMTLNNISSINPDIIVLMPEGFSMDRSVKEAGRFLTQADFNNLKAIKNNRLYIADSSKYFYQPARELVDSIEILAEIINPKQFVFGYEGEGWMKFSV